jgi:O-antigen ligase
VAALRPRLLSIRPGLENADLLLLGALVVLTAAFGPSFSLLAVDGHVLELTELTMLAVLLLALRRLGLSAALALARRRLPLLALGVLWASAAVALARGLSDFDLSQLIYDVRLLEYSLLLPIVVLVVDSRERLSAMVEALVLGALAGTVLFGLTALSARAFDTTAWLSDSEGEIAMAGLYAGIFLVWLVARLGTGRRPGRAEILIGGLGAVLIGLTSKRAIWVAMLITLPAVALASERSRRARLALAGAAVVILGIGAAVGIETVLGEPVPKTAAAAEAEADAGDGGGGTQATAEITGLTGGDSTEGENVRWRIAYWEELLSRSLDQPVFGAGFGPAEFRWEGQEYDFRTGDDANANDVTGPHNAFISVLYATGLVGLAALIAVIAFPLPAAVRHWRTASSDRRIELVTIGGTLLATTGLACFSEAFRAQFLALFFWIPLGLLMVERDLGDERASASLRPDEARPARDPGAQRVAS